jgi:hypothetical protein
VNPQPLTEHLEVRNYAIVGDQLVNFSGGGPRKIALSELDLQATSSANEDRLVNFRLPTDLDGRKNAANH